MTVDTGVDVTEACFGIVWVAILPLTISSFGGISAVTLAIVFKKTNYVSATYLRFSWG
jgi:hypothetical protein